MKTRILLLALASALICTAACGATQAAAAGLMAPAGTCAAAPRGAVAEEATMLCLTNYARAQSGDPALEPAVALQDSASEKAEDIVRCDTFSHYACGREFTYWIRANGYLSSACWHVGENLAWGTGEYGTVNSIFRAWLRSPSTAKTCSTPNSARSVSTSRSAAWKAPAVPTSGRRRSAPTAEQLSPHTGDDRADVAQAQVAGSTRRPTGGRRAGRSPASAPGP